MVAPSETKPSRDENVTAKQSNRRLLLISVQTWRFQPRSRRLICSLGRFRCRAHLHRGYTRIGTRLCGSSLRSAVAVFDGPVPIWRGM